jgi:conjugative transfer signal peptidase TraF
MTLPFSKLQALCVSPLVIATLAVGASHFIGVNTTASAAPVGFYLRTAPRPERGQLVEICLPPSVAKFGVERGYIGRSWRCPDGSEAVGKVLAGVAGDVVTIDPATVLKTDSHGRSLDHFPFGKYRVKPGEVWLYGSAWNSWDSKYYGAVPVQGIRANLSPIWTW